MKINSKTNKNYISVLLNRKSTCRLDNGQQDGNDQLPDDKMSGDDAEEFISKLDFSTLVDARSEDMFNGCHFNFTGPQLPN